MTMSIIEPTVKIYNKYIYNMKHNLLLLALTSFILVGCEASTEKKIEKMVNEEVKKSLYIPDSYDPVETIVDSAFSPLDNPYFLNDMQLLSELGKEMNNLEHQANRAKSSMSIWGNSYGYYSSFERNEFEEAKAAYDKIMSQQTMIQNNVETISNELREIMEEGNYFIGYKATHRYRAKNNAGQTIMNDAVFIIDTELTKVIGQYDAETYRGIQMAVDFLSNYQ